MSLSQRWQAFRNAEDLFALISSQAETIREKSKRLDELEPKAKPAPPKPRGVVVTKVGLNDKGEQVQILDEYPDGDDWRRLIPLYMNVGGLKTVTGEQAYGLMVVGVDGRGIAEYEPHTFIRVEAGSARDIREHKA